MRHGRTSRGMSAFNIWRENPPPRNTWVWAKFKLTKDKWIMVKTCKRGCCVYHFGEALILPKFWRDATPEEIAAEEEACSKIKPIDVWALLK
jgi:hypothetical protein